MLTRPLIVLALLVFSGSPAFADREPNPDERARIETALRAAGYQRWEEIELDDGVWEIDDAVGADGRERDLKLDPTTFAIIQVEND